MVEMGADGIDYDTVASTGDAEFLAVLRATETIADETRHAGRDRHVGRDGARLPRPARVQRQAARRHVAAPAAEGCEEAGAAIFGPVVNTNTKKSCAWNLARAADLRQGLHRDAKIPIHPNVGMGVGGVPMFEAPPSTS